MPNGRFIGRCRCTGDSIAMDYGHHRARDQEQEGKWSGTFAGGCKYSQDTTGRLSIHSADDDLIATFEPGEFRVVESDEGVHVNRLGDHNPHKGPETPERLDDVHDSAPVTLAMINRRNADYWSGRSADKGSVKGSDRALAAGIVAGSADDSPQTMQARIKAINARNKQYYGS